MQYMKMVKARCSSRRCPSTFDISLSYDDFYQGDGQYLVVVEAGGRQDNEFLEIVGEDFTNSPGRKALPPTIISSDLYPQLMLLLIGMFAAVSVRNHMHPESRSLPLDLVFLACGGVVLLAAIVSMRTDMAVVGIVFTGMGAAAVMAKPSDLPIKAMIIKDSHPRFCRDAAGVFMYRLYCHTDPAVELYGDNRDFDCILYCAESVSGKLDLHMRGKILKSSDFNNYILRRFTQINLKSAS
jgi:hypothetical protein